MSEFCLSGTTKTPLISSLLLSDFMLLCSFILSHPLYFSYFIFFSPYLLKLLSFLSPLFITTSLLLLALLTGFPEALLHYSHHTPQLPDSKAGFLLATYNAVLERLRPKVECENQAFHDYFDAYRIVFETAPTFEERYQNPVETLDLQVPEENGLPAPGVKCSSLEALTSDSQENPPSEIAQPMAGEKRLECFLQEMGESKDMSHRVGEKEVKPQSTEFNKVEENKEEPLTRSGSKGMNSTKISGGTVAKFSDDSGGEDTSTKVMENSGRIGVNFGSINGGGDYYNSKVMENSQTLGANLGSFGSMRKEKEWKRTLACKLFEERHNVDGGGEGMDMLWETYEMDSKKVEAKTKTKKGKKGGFEYFYKHDDEESEEEEEEEVDGQLCCLQALKFSAGKMNLGMGRPNLVRISKALKGIGWLHHVTKHGKKGHN